MNEAPTSSRYFTLAEARNLLPELRKSLTEIRRIYIELNGIGFDVYHGKYRPGYHPDTLEAYPKLYHRFLHLVRQILDSGVQIKSIEQGLVDFPAVRANGERVLLCWQPGEPDILFWHGMHDGFKGRQPIESF